MPQITGDILTLTYAGVKTVFDTTYNAANLTSKWNLIATEIPTTLPVQDYAWLGNTVIMELLKDRPREQVLNDFAYRLADEIYKGRLFVKRKDIEDDQYGLINIRTRDMAEAAVRKWEDLAFNGLVQGFIRNCYDGQYFFDNDHSFGKSGIQSNISTASLSSTSLDAAATAMMLYVDELGEPMNIEPDTLVVGPLNAKRAWDLTESQVVVVNPGDGTAGTGAVSATDYSNYHRGKYNVVVSPRIRGYQWFLLDTKRSIKPIIIQSRSDVPITTETDMLDPKAMMNEEYRFDVRGRFVQGYGLWQLAYGSNATS